MLVLLLSIFLTVTPAVPGEAVPDPEVQIEESMQNGIQEEEIEVEESVSESDELNLDETEEPTSEELEESLPDDQNMVKILNDISNDVDLLLAASIEPSVDAYQVSDYYQNYFRGVLQNMPYTEYLCYAERYQYSSGYNYVTHYYLMYDLVIENGQVVPGVYPCLDVYAENNVYYLEQTTKSFEGYPTMGFASFAPYSALIDRSFDYRSLYVGLACVLVFFLIARKTVFS